MQLITVNPYLNNCTRPRSSEVVNTINLFMINPYGKLIKKETMKAAMCAPIIIPPIGTGCL